MKTDWFWETSTDARTSTARIESEVAFRQRAESGEATHSFVRRGIARRMTTSFSFFFRFHQGDVFVRWLTASARERRAKSRAIAVYAEGHTAAVDSTERYRRDVLFWHLYGGRVPCVSRACLQRQFGSLVPDALATYSNDTQRQPGCRHEIRIGRSFGISTKSVLCSVNLYARAE